MKDDNCAIQVSRSLEVTFIQPNHFDFFNSKERRRTNPKRTWVLYKHKENSGT